MLSTPKTLQARLAEMESAMIESMAPADTRSSPPPVGSVAASGEPPARSRVQADQSPGRARESHGDVVGMTVAAQKVTYYPSGHDAANDGGARKMVSRAFHNPVSNILTRVSPPVRGLQLLTDVHDLPSRSQHNTSTGGRLLWDPGSSVRTRQSWGWSNALPRAPRAHLSSPSKAS